ncbi:MAG TPA: ATP-binding protein, partial [Kofleriaceae bacterium]
GLPGDHRAAPEKIELSSDSPDRWPLGLVLANGGPIVVGNLGARFGPLPGGEFPEPAHSAILLPLVRPGVAHPYGVLVAGISPRRAIDDRYRGFFDLAADHLATAIGNAHAIEQQRRRTDELAALDRAKTAFFSNISHEFRTPLALMLGPLDELLAGRHGEVSPGVALQHQLVHRNTLRLHKLVNAMLDFARIEAGRARALFAPTDLATLTTELAGMFRAAVERAGLELVVDCPPLAEPVYVDREMWEKIVLNLLSNAFKFTFHGRIRVTLRPAAEFVELTVRDTGCGIPADEVARVFERFHRVERVRARTHEGTGIGLSLALELARLHGGSIDVASELGSGTTFTVKIRAGRAHVPGDQLVAESHGNGIAAAFVEEALRWLPDETVVRAEVAPATSGARVLVADDNADMRDYLRRVIAPCWQVITVADGAAALAEIRRTPPDIVVTDVMMPGLDGFGLIAALRADERTRELPVVVVSARAGDEARAEGIEAGADDYLVKPFHARELLARISTQLAAAEARREARASTAELRDALAVLDCTLASVPVGLCIYDRDLRVVRMNDQLARWIGITAASARGRALDEVAPAQLVAATEVRIRSVFATGRPSESMPLAIFTPASPDVRHWLLTHYPVRAPSGEVAHVGVVVVDVTAERRALAAAELQKRHLHALLVQAPLPICILRGGEHAIDLANDSARAAWGELGPAAAWPESPAELDQVLATGEPYFGKEARLEVGGRAHFYNYVFAPMRDVDDTIGGVLVIASEVTDQVRARRELSRTVEYNERFTAVLGHDLRNPLNAITTSAQLLLRRTNQVDLARPAQRIVYSADRMARMITQLLDLTRVRVASGLTLQPRPLDLGELCQLVIDELCQGNPEARVELAMTGSLHGNWDGDRLAQVVSNLVGNAIEHGDARAAVQVQLDGRDRIVSMSIANRGAIAPEVMATLFEPFRGSRQRVEKTRGLGLGLYISKEIIVAHRGTLDVRSSQDDGTCFEIELPKSVERTP